MNLTRNPHIPNHEEVVSMLADNILFLKFLLHFSAISIWNVTECIGSTPIHWDLHNRPTPMFSETPSSNHRIQTMGKVCQSRGPCHKPVPYWSLHLGNGRNFQRNFSSVNVDSSKSISLIGKRKFQWISQFLGISLWKCWYPQKECKFFVQKRYFIYKCKYIEE